MMIGNAPTLIIALTVMLGSAPAGAGSAAAPPGAASCSGCHAPAALGTAVPSIEGQSTAEIAAAMEEYRLGRRPATVMDRIAKGFSEEEIRAIAVWLSVQR